jgi:multidrug efflux pump subunit AcrB
MSLDICLLLIAAQYESYLVPLSILLSLPVGAGAITLPFQDWKQYLLQVALIMLSG